MDAFHEMMVKEKNPLAINFVDVLKAREIEFAEKMRTVSVAPAIKDWAVGMAAQHGSMVKVGHMELDWLTALMVVRYGEATYHWPPAYSPQDLSRAMAWKNGVTPSRVIWAKSFYGG